MRASSVCSAALLLVALPAFADTYTYTYTGNPFVGVGTSPYTEIDRITGFITTASPIGSNLTSLTVIPVLSYSFTDGQQTYQGSADSFSLQTNGAGQISGWDIMFSNTITEIVGGFPEVFISELETMNTPGSGPSAGALDYSCLYQSHSGCQAQGGNQDDPGTWSETVTAGPVAATPEPSALWLALTGVLGGGGLIRRQSSRV